jgi:hypothetical protein
MPEPLGIVCTHVLHGERPILYVAREDNDIVLACGRRDHRADSIDDWGMAHPSHFSMGDPALGVIRRLTVGEQAVRLRVGAAWMRARATGSSPFNV